MSRFGTGRGRREDVLEMLERADPQRHAELLELRRYNPQAYRRAVKRLAEDYALSAPIRGDGVADDEVATPGRETDPALRIGPAPTTSPDTAAPVASRPVIARPAPTRAAPPEQLPDTPSSKPAKKTRKKES